MSEISFRPCTPEDVDIAVPLIFNSGPAAFRYVFSESYEDEALDFLQAAFIKHDSEFGYQQHTAVLLDGKMVGIGAVRYAEQNSEFMLGALKAIFSFYGLWAALKVSKRGNAVEQIFKPPTKHTGSLYHLSIEPTNQGKGLGSAMIEYFVNQVERQGCNQLGLDVS